MRGEASEADYDGGRRDDREGVHGDTPYSPHRRDRAPRQLYTELLLAWVT